MKQDHEDGKFLIVNRCLLLVLTVVLISGYLIAEKASVMVREVRHQLGGEAVVERCVTCHDPAAHSPMKGHAPLTEACTPCHDGFGRGITPVSAHAKERGADTLNSILAREALFAGCLRCHPPRMLPPDSLAVQGWKHFLGKGCGSCHQVRGISSGVKGPDLSRIGDHLTVEALESGIRQPQIPGYYSVMPAFSLGVADSRALAIFLKGQSRLDLRPAAYQAGGPEAADPLERYNCVSCHRFRQKDGMLGPDLDRLYAQRSEKWLKGFLGDVSSQRPSARMPELTDARAVAAVVAELLKPPAKIVMPASPGDRYELLCSRCHGKLGDGKGPIAANLSGAPRRFSENPGYFLLTPRERMIGSVADGLPGVSMPPFGKLMTKEEEGALLDFILAEFAKTGPPGQLTDIAVPPKSALPEGLAPVYARLCAHCHGEGGDRSARIVHPKNPQPRNFRNRAYMEAMPDEQLFRALAKAPKRRRWFGT
ncbi:MAG TPA: hypothetical protein DDY22_16400 [Geobacter sp.]|nr:hypothetical protein [Geobacter sp.]